MHLHVNAPLYIHSRSLLFSDKDSSNPLLSVEGEVTPTLHFKFQRHDYYT